MADAVIASDKTAQRGAAWRWVIVVVIMAAIFLASSIPDKEKPPDPFEYADKALHFIAYAILAAGVYAAARRTWPWKERAFFCIVAVAIASLYGVTDELHQHAVPGRSREFLDWVADTVGATFAAVIADRVNRKGGP